MQYYLKPAGGAHCLFTILDSQGNAAYEVTGKGNPFGRRFLLVDRDHNIAGRISGVRISNTVQYSAAAGGERMRVSINCDSLRCPVRIKGKRWRFRGSILTRSFDVLDESSKTVMTHGKCWRAADDCYGIEISPSESVPLCLCLAVMIDCTIPSGCRVAVPAGG